MASCNWRQANELSESDTEDESDVEGKIFNNYFFVL